MVRQPNLFTDSILDHQRILGITKPFNDGDLTIREFFKRGNRYERKQDRIFG